MDPLTGALICCLGAVVYANVGYPLLIGVLALFAPSRRATPSARPQVTLIIAAHNERAVIAAKIRNTLALDYPRDALSVVLVDDGSTDDTAEIATHEGNAQVKVLQRSYREGKGAALNHGASVAVGEVLVFSDANALCRRDALAALVSVFSDRRIGLATGHKATLANGGAVGEGDAAYWSYESFLRRNETRLGSTVAVTGEMLGVRRELFQEFPQGVINDDAFLCMSVLRRGYRVVCVSEAMSVKGTSATHRDEVLRRCRVAAGRWQLMCRLQWWPWRRPFVMFELISHKLLRLLAPFFLVAAFAINMVLLLRSDATAAVWACFAIQAGVYLLAVAGFAHGPEARGNPVARVAAYFVAGNVANGLGLFTYLTGRATPLWARAHRSEPLPFDQR